MVSGSCHAGVVAASVVVAPSVWMRDSVRASYARAGHDTVIYNGRNPIFFNPYVGKDDSVLAVGRLWDAGKQVSLLTQHSHPLPVCIVGADTPIHDHGRFQFVPMSNSRSTR